MPLAAGQSLSFFEILGPLGAGGMGEVYRARDTRLGREVAIKVLPEHLAEDEERLRRFEREARTLASLNHPNVAGIHGVDQEGDLCFLALELVPGEDLAERIARGPLPVDEAVDVCRQIAEGLEAAHEAGVVHRDLKPANVRVTPEGVVKILDFGLARSAAERGSGVSRAPSTDSFLVTSEGTVLGTPTYMSPEQARGRPVDRRTDVWAFGCVLFECLTGERAFGGESFADVLGAIVGGEPRLDALPSETPRRVRELVASCLVKDPRRRLRDVGDARIALERWREPDAVDAGGSGAAPRRSRWALAGLWALSLAVVGFAAWRLADGAAAPARAPTLRASILLPPDLVLSRRESAVSLSPQGDRMVLIAGPAGGEMQLWVRTLDGRELQPLTGTTDASYPFWSPDGTRIGFTSGGKLRTVPAAGGAVSVVCDSPMSRGATWGPDGTIVFAPGPFQPLMRVPAGGGTPVPLTSAPGDFGQRLPELLPDGRHLLYFQGYTAEDGLHLMDLETGESRRLLDASSGASWCEPGYLVWHEGEGLVAQRFDLDTFELSGAPRRIAEDVDYNRFRHRGRYSLARDGTLVYYGDPYRLRLRWREADGAVGPWVGEVGRYDQFSLSPDGAEAAVICLEPGGEIVLRVLAVDRGLGRVVARGVALQAEPVWSPDDRRVAYRRIQERGERSFEARVVDLETGEDRQLADGGWVVDWSREAATLALCEQMPELGFEVSVIPVEGGDRRPLFSSDLAERYLGFSPDGRFVGFLRGEQSGWGRLYVSAFPGPGPVFPVSSDLVRGRWWWLDDGRIAYATPDGRVWAVPVGTAGAMPDVGDPEPLFGGVAVLNEGSSLTRDAGRMLEAVLPDPVTARRLNLLTGWQGG